MCAGAQLGAELIFINTELPPQQLHVIVHRHNPDVLVYDEEYAATLCDTQYRGLSVLTGREPSGTVDGGAPTLDELAAQRYPLPPPVRRPVRITLLTSGTTGVSKGVPRTVNPRAIALLCATAMGRIRLRSTDTVLVATPFFHGFGLVALLGPLALGATVICRGRFDAGRTLQDIAQYRVTAVMAVPVMLQRMLAVPGLDPVVMRRSSLRMIVTGAAPISPATVAAVIDAFGPILVNGYGSTEAGLVTIAAPADLVAAPNTAGRRALGVSVRVLRADRTDARVGEIGLIFVRSGLEYTGYTPDADDAAVRPETKEIIAGHVDTGDMGHFDAQGRLYIDGRSDDMIVSGGENVFPGEVEDRLATHRSVSDAVVVGVADAEFGQVLHAFIVPAADEPEPSERELARYIRDGLERYKVPKQFVAVEEIPRNASGKVVRSKLHPHNGR